ncbi:hypothetical protein [Phyllobacterium sp. P5_D12]
MSNFSVSPMRVRSGIKALLAGCAFFATTSAHAEDAKASDPAIPFTISVDGEKVDGSPSSRTGPTVGAARELQNRKTDLGLSSVDIQVKFDGLDVSPILNLSTMPIRRAYKAGEKVDFLATSNYPAFIEKSEIRILDAEHEPADKPIDVIPVTVNGQAA